MSDYFELAKTITILCFVATLPIQLIGLLLIGTVVMFSYASALIGIFAYLIYKRQKRVMKQLTKPIAQWFPNAFSEYKQMMKDAERRKHGTATVST